MKNFLRKWLEVPQPCNHYTIAEIRAEVRAEVNEAITKYTESTCSQCGKNIFAHYGGFYRNANGQVFCSNDCVNKNRDLLD